MSSHNLNRTFTGEQGYKRLAKLVARAFYTGDLPPREEDEDGAPAANRRLPKHTFEGLAIILIDYLTSNKVDGYVDEQTIASDLRLSQKNIRKTLRYLEGEHLVAMEQVKLAFKRTNIEVDDAEVQEQYKRRETRVFWCMDYPRLRDALQLRILKVRELLKKHAAASDGVQQYICPQCGSKYSSLDAASLLDFSTGAFICEVTSCATELIDHYEVEGPRGMGDGSSKERLAFFKGLQERVEIQLKPLIDQLEKIKETDPPDYGSLQDWYQTKREEAELRQARLEAARKKAAGIAGSAAAAMAHLTEDQLLEWAERAEVVVALPSAEGGSMAASAPGPGKEVPLWFRTDATALGAASGVSEEAADKVSEEEQRRILEEQYLQQYLAQIRQAQPGVGGPPGVGVAGEVEEDKDGRDTKRIKLETVEPVVAAAAAVAVQQVQQQEGVKAEEEQAAKKEEEAVAWEEVPNGGGEEAGGDMDWEDA